MARPTKLTLELREEIARHVRNGNLPEASARVSGISSSTFYSWMDRGRKGVLPYSEFSENIERACAEAEVNAAGALIKIGETRDWRALAWWLERRFPEKWGKDAKNEKTIEEEWMNASSQTVSIADIEAAVQEVVDARRRGQNLDVQNQESFQNKEQFT